MTTKINLIAPMPCCMPLYDLIDCPIDGHSAITVPATVVCPGCGKRHKGGAIEWAALRHELPEAATFRVAKKAK